MSKLRYVATFFFTFALPAAFADEFDPTTYLKEQEVTTSPATLTQSDVVIKGVPYHVLRSSAGILFLPKMERPTKDDLEKGLCANQIPYDLDKCGLDDHVCEQRNHDRMTEEVTIVRAETPISGSLMAYAEIVGETIRRKCGDVSATYFSPLSLKPEVGVSWKGGTDRQPTTNKVYIPWLYRGLGFKSEW